MKSFVLTLGKCHPLLFALALLISFSSLAYSSAPQWWSQPWPSGTSNVLVSPVLPADDYGVANLGQLKYSALRAYYYLEATLPAGAGTEVEQIIAQFYDLVNGVPIVSPTTDDFAAVNQGQLKYILKPYYDRLLEYGYVTWHMLGESGAHGWSNIYPWTPSTSDDSSYSPVLIGQLKFAFSFNIQPPYKINLGESIDSNSDYMDDRWEEFYDLGDMQWHDIMAGTNMPLHELYLRRLDPRNTDADGDGILNHQDPDHRRPSLQIYFPGL